MSYFKNFPVYIISLFLSFVAFIAGFYLLYLSKNKEKTKNFIWISKNFILAGVVILFFALIKIFKPSIANKEHFVATGWSILSGVGEEISSGVEITKVFFRKLSKKFRFDAY